MEMLDGVLSRRVKGDAHLLLPTAPVSSVVLAGGSAAPGRRFAPASGRTSLSRTASPSPRDGATLRFDRADRLRPAILTSYPPTETALTNIDHWSVSCSRVTRSGSPRPTMGNSRPFSRFSYVWDCVRYGAGPPIDMVDPA